MQDTSLQAYYGIVDKLPAKRKAVFEIIRISGPLCNESIALRLGWAINRVTGRVKELRDAGLVEDAGTVKRNGYNVHTWRIKYV